MVATDVPIANCGDDCNHDPFCGAWFSNDTACYKGIGYECGAPAATGPAAGQRILHGSVRILATITNVKVNGLKLAFDQTHHAVQADAEKDCMYTCYSNLFCQYWQYVVAEGCFVEDPTGGQVADYPLFTGNGGGTTQMEAGGISKGEFIQHYCLETLEGVPARPIPGFPRPAQQDPGRPPRFDNAPMSASASLIGAVLMCCSGFAMLAYTLTRSPKPESKKKATKPKAAAKKRGINPKPAPKPDVETPAPQAPQYMQMPMLTPAVQMVQPMSTVSAAPLLSNTMPVTTSMRVVVR